MRKLSSTNVPKKETRKASAGLVKASGGFKGLFGSKKKKSEGIATEDVVKKELKVRLFFTERVQLSDEEILNNIGSLSLPKEVAKGINEIVNAAAVMKKFMKEKDNGKPSPKENKLDGIGLGVPTSIMYVGALKGRLAARQAKLQPIKGDTKLGLVVNSEVLNTTRFLGKMLSRRDKHGLYTGTPDSSKDDEDPKARDNPLFLALEKAKIKSHVSLDSGESRAGSRASHTSRKSNISLGQDGQDIAKLGKGEVLGGLQKGLSKVKPATIGEWNLHKHVRGDRELKPIFIPF